MKKANVYIIHENEAWIEPLKRFLEELNLSYENWFIDKGSINLNEIPPEIGAQGNLPEPRQKRLGPAG